MANKKTIEEINMVIAFGEWLTYRMSELKVSQTELADELGISEKTVGRYMHGENAKLPPDETITIINRFFREKSRYRTYIHQPAKVFGNLLRDIIERMGLTQQQTAILTGKNQSDISKIISCGLDPKPTIYLNAKEQYDILVCLYDEAKGKYGIAPENGMYSFQWDVILGYYDGSENYEVVYSDPYDINSFCFNWSFYLLFSDYDVNIQNLMLRYPHAFFEQSKDMKRAGSIENKTFAKRYKRMKEYLSLPQKERSSFIRKLECVEGPRMVSVPDEAEQNYYLAVAEMTMLICEKNDLCSDKENIKLKEKNCRRFRKLMTEIGLEIDSESEMDMKKDFSSEEWYVWRQMLIDEHNKELQNTEDSLAETCPNTEYFEYR